MIFYMKYPIKDGAHQKLGMPKFCIVSRTENYAGYLLCFTKTGFDKKGNYTYEKENKMGFFSKPIERKNIMVFKGGFLIEKCEKSERIEMAKKWYKETKQSLPRKIKKKLFS